MTHDLLFTDALVCLGLAELAHAQGHWRAWVWNLAAVILFLRALLP